MYPKVWFLALAAIAGLTLVATAHGQPAAGSARPPAPTDPNLIQPDPSILRGTLPNGLRYAIMRNATPAGALSIRLAMDVGGYDEADNELEAAHFVEHMTFRAPLSFAGEDASKAFEALGVGFGRDQNAETGIYSTVYRLDLPRVDEPLLDLSFRWLRDVADGTGFRPDAVNAERGVILAEHSSHMSPAFVVGERINAFEAPNVRSVERTRTNSAQALASLDAQRLSAFYQRWYRPENAILVVVGDAPVEEIRSRIEKSFGSWLGVGPLVHHTPLVRPDEKRPEDIMTLSEPAAPSELQVCRLRGADPRGQDDVARLRRANATAVWAAILGRRLDKIASGSNPPFFNPQVQSVDDFREIYSACIDVKLINDAWRPALDAVQAELRRFSVHGPTQAEVDGVVDETRDELRGDVSHARTRNSGDLAATIADNDLRGDITPAPAELLRAYDTAVENLTPADISAAYGRDWSGAGPILVVVSPQAPSSDAVRSAWSEGQAKPVLDQTVDAKPMVWSYRDFGKPGRVAKREDFPAQGFVRLRFDNGVVLNFKHTGFEADSVTVRVRFGAGRREVPNPDYAAAIIGAALFPYGGLGRHSYEDMAAIFRGDQWSATMAVGDNAFVLSGKTYPGGLQHELQILAAYLSDPGFRPDVDQRLGPAFNAFYRSYRTTPILVLSEAMVHAIAPGSPVSLPPEEVLSSLRMADFQRVLKPALTSAPLEVTVVGDLDEQTAVDLVAKTLGALPPRPTSNRARADTWFLRFPPALPAVIRATHEGAADRAVIGVLWPLYVAEPSRRPEEIALDILSRAFTDQLRHRVRVEMGEAYDPQVVTRMPDGADQGEMLAVVEVPPADVDKVIGEIRKMADGLAKGDIPDEVVEAARAPLLSNEQSELKTNAYWAAGLNGSAERDPALADFMATGALLGSVTDADVRKAAATWLSHPPIVVVAMPSSATPPKSPDGAKP